MSHDRCTAGHVCQQPSGRTCIEPGCDLPAGTWWGAYWCPDCDRERLDRVTAQLEAIKADLKRLPIHRTEAGYPNCSTCEGGGCHDCTDPAW